MDLAGLPDDPLERLYAHQREREREKVLAALAKPLGERTAQEERVIAYSPYGTAAGCATCGCKG